MTEHQVQFKQWPCRIVKTHYQIDDSTALLLVHATEGDPVAKATVNVEGVELAADEVIIKDYAENAGMLECLTAAGIVEPTGRDVALPYGILAPICKLLI